MLSLPEVNLALVDDHSLFRKGLISLIETVGVAERINYKILLEASNGKRLKELLPYCEQPDIILMDISMPIMDGFGCVEWLSKEYPLIKILVISMIEKEESIMRMIRLGVKGYLSKDVEPRDLGNALRAVMEKGFYYTDYVTGRLLHSLQNEKVSGGKLNSMSDREKEFLGLACSELTYQEIAARMFLSPKTIDGYRNALFEKFEVKSRVGLALFAVRNGLVKL